MARGGKRSGAGRKAGSKNKRNAELLAKLLDNGEQTPLDFLLGVMREFDGPMDIRLEAAKAAAPYVHPKLSTVEHKGGLDITTHEAALKELR